MNQFRTLANRLLLSTLLMFASVALAPTSVAQDSAVSTAELEQMLAPVALYPDTVLSHILIAATYPVDVVHAARWAQANRDLTAAAAIAAVESKDWDPSVKALVAFPQILQRMNEELAWTERLGHAFLQDETAVMESVQALRERAYNNGNLADLEHLQVQREAESIVIEPVQKQVVYIPYYDSRAVYGAWRWHDHPPVYWSHPTYVVARPGGWFHWSSGVHVPPHIFFSSFHWRRGHIVVVDLYSHPTRFYSHRDIIHHQHGHRWRHHWYHDHRPTRVYSGSRRDSNSGFDNRAGRVRHTPAQPILRQEPGFPHAGRPTQGVVTTHPGRHTSSRIGTGTRNANESRRHVQERDTRPPAGVIQQHPRLQTERESSRRPGGRPSSGHMQSPHRLPREGD